MDPPGGLGLQIYGKGLLRGKNALTPSAGLLYIEYHIQSNMKLDRGAAYYQYMSRAWPAF